MSYPFMNLSYKTKSGLTVKLGDRVLVADGGADPLAFVWHIEDSSGGKTIKVILVNELRNLLNVYATGQRQAPFKSGKTGYYHIDDGVSHGLVFCLIEGLNDEQMRAEYVKLKAWHDRHGATGGTDDDSQSPNPGDIQFPPWKPGEGKEGGTGTEGGGGTATGPVEHPGKTGEGEVTGAPDDRTEYHPADTNRDGFIDREEKKAWNKKNPDNPVEKT